MLLQRKTSIENKIINYINVVFILVCLIKNHESTKFSCIFFAIFCNFDKPQKKAKPRDARGFFDMLNNKSPLMILKNLVLMELLLKVVRPVENAISYM